MGTNTQPSGNTSISQNIDGPTNLVNAKYDPATGLADLATTKLIGQTVPGAAGIVSPASTASGMRALRKAIDQVRTGVAASGPVFCLGDSTMRGPNNVHAQSFITYAVALLVAGGVPASIDSVYGASNAASAAAFVAADPRVALGAGWALSAVRTAGGFCFEFPANTTPTAFSFTPASGAAWNQVDIYYYQNSGAALGTFAVDRGGVAPTAGSPVNANTAPQLMAKATLNWAATATGTLNIQVPNNTSPKIRIVGVALRDTANPKLEFINAAWAGSSSQDWISGINVQTGPWSPPSCVTATNPVCLIWNHKVNDFNVGTTAGGNSGPTGVPAYSANQSTYASLVAGASFMNVRTAQSDPAAFAAIADQESYFSTDLTLAAAGGWPVVDFQSVCGGYTQAVADALTLDQRHFNSLGYQRGARQLARAILGL